MRSMASRKAYLRSSETAKGALVQAVQQRLAGLGADALAGQQRRGGLEGAGLAAAEDLAEVEAQQAFFVPLAAVDEQELGVGGEQHPAWWLRAGEDPAAEDVFQAGAQPVAGGMCVRLAPRRLV
jgi:hypothetical protein